MRKKCHVLFEWPLNTVSVINHSTLLTTFHVANFGHKRSNFVRLAVGHFLVACVRRRHDLQLFIQVFEGEKRDDHHDEGDAEK